MFTVSMVIIAIGIVLIAIPDGGSDLNVVDREDVWLSEGAGTMTSLDIDSRGRYQVWVVDEKPGEEDLPFMVFEIDDGEIHVERSDGSVVRDIDGVPHELVVSFRLDDMDIHYYDTWPEGDLTGDIYVELVFTKSSVWTIRPSLWAGVFLILTGIMVLLMHFLRTYRRTDGPY